MTTRSNAPASSSASGLTPGLKNAEHRRIQAFGLA